MIRVLEHFDGLHFTETLLGDPVIQGRTVSIPVQRLLTLGNHPLSAEGAGLMRGTLVFRGVAISRRVLTEYIGDPRNPEGFKEDYVVEDVPPPISDKEGTYRMYSFEGLLEQPVAWVDWDVEAISFELLVDDNGRRGHLYI